LFFLKAQARGIFYLLQLAHLTGDIVGYFTIEFDQGDGFSPVLVAPQMEGRDIKASLPQNVSQCADIARFVMVHRIKHMRPKLGFHVDALDLDDARIAVGKDGPGNGALASIVGFHHGLLLPHQCLCPWRGPVR